MCSAPGGVPPAPPSPQEADRTVARGIDPSLLRGAIYSERRAQREGAKGAPTDPCRRGVASLIDEDVRGRGGGRGQVAFRATGGPARLESCHPVSVSCVSLPHFGRHLSDCACLDCEPRNLTSVVWLIQVFFYQYVFETSLSLPPWHLAPFPFFFPSPGIQDVLMKYELEKAGPG